MGKITWSQDKLDIVKTYLENGLSYKEIAKQFKTNNSVIEKVASKYDLKKFIKKDELPTLKLEELKELDDINFDELKENAKLKWDLPKTKIPKNNKKSFETGLLWSDTHIPHQNVPAVKAVLKLMEDIKFDRICNIGDFLDYGCISHWNKSKRRTLELKRLKNDYIAGNALLDEIDKRLPKNCDKSFLFGNHEVWIDDLLEDIPALEGMVEPETQLFLKERGYKVYPYNEIIKWGKLNITHGIYATGNSVKKHLDELKVNIAFGHTHTVAMMLSSSPAREIAFSGYNIGALCDLAPEYMKNRPHAWSHGFAVVYIFPNGYFDVQLIRIVEGKFVFNGKVYDGNN